MARARVERAPLPELLSLIDALYGRDALRYGDDVEAVREEALRQLAREWTNPEWVRDVKPELDAWAHVLRADRAASRSVSHPAEAGGQ